MLGLLGLLFITLKLIGVSEVATWYPHIKPEALATARHLEGVRVSAAKAITPDQVFTTVARIHRRCRGR